MAKAATKKKTKKQLDEALGPDVETAAPAPEPDPGVQLKDGDPVEASKWPAMKMELRSTTDLIAYGGNARKHSDRQVMQIANSMKEFGWTIPILVDESNLVLAGHGRLAAAKKLGRSEVPVVVARGWTAAQKRAYVLADNQLALNSNWNPDTLSSELRTLVELDFDLDLLGFEPEQLADMIADIEPIEFGSGEVNPSMSKVLHIRWNNRVIPLEVVEADALDARYNDYVAKNGSAVGFVKSLFTSI